jgi:spermidine synthase
MILALPLVLLAQMAGEGTTHLGMMVATNLTTLFVAAMVCHGELARSRPASARLTEYYLWIALGGALGSGFNALLAPVLFSWVVEYPLALALTAFLLPAMFPGNRPPIIRLANRIVPVALGCVVAIYFLSNHHQFNQEGRVVHEERTFFGIYRIVRGSERNTSALLHGHVWHGMQIDSDDARLRRLPLLYYSQASPIGQLFFAFHGSPSKSRVAVIGLGIGSLAGYADAGQEFTFFEIDRGVARIARDSRYFTFLADAEARGATVRIVPGDGRLSLEWEQNRRYGMIILDAFTGDAIPAHLLTREAFQMYMDHLEEDGLLALHITNDYVNLEPIIAELAWDQKLVALIQNYRELSLEDCRRGQTPSIWAVVARQRKHLGSLPESKRWKYLERPPTSILWRDDYTNLLPILRWN